MPEIYDLIVIGAGVNGVGTAKLAAESGLKVLILEQYPEAAAVNLPHGIQPQLRF